MGPMRDLQRLDLSRNRLTGTLPASFCKDNGLPSLQILKLDQNRLKAVSEQYVERAHQLARDSAAHLRTRFAALATVRR
jgi:hypothetical protein